jgi:UDP-N-acetylglucosamine 2-epimerase (non-hydrolysing)
MNAGQSLNQLLIHGLSQIENVYTDGQKRDAIAVVNFNPKEIYRISY